LNEESAQRHREDDKIIQIMNKRIEAMERYLENKVPEESNRLLMLIEKNRLEYLDSRDTHDKAIAQLESKILNPSSSIAQLFSQPKPGEQPAADAKP